MAFSYNPASSKGYDDQYFTYLQNNSLISKLDSSIQGVGGAIDRAIRSQTEELEFAISTGNREIISSIQESSHAICSTLEFGFSELNYSLNKLENELVALSKLVGVGISLMLEQMKISNHYLGQIESLLRIPDSQKQRVYHISEGLKYLHNALRQSPNSEFYTDALEEFRKSEAIENKDYFALYYIGYIYLRSISHFDPAKAQACFRKSARYYLAESAVGGTNVSVNLIRADNFRQSALEALLYAAESSYLQRNLIEAIELSKQAWDISPDVLKAGFFQSKYLAAAGRTDDAVRILEMIIRKDRFISLDVLNDQDLVSKADVTRLLDKLSDEAHAKADSLLSKCADIAVECSMANDELASLRSMVDTRSYLDCLKAVDLIQEEKQRTFSKVHKKAAGRYCAHCNLDELPSILEDLRSSLKEDQSALLRELFSYISDESQWRYSGIDHEDLFSADNLTAKTPTSTLLDFLEQERSYYNGLPGLKDQIINKVKQIRKIDRNEYHERMRAQNASRNRQIWDHAASTALSWTMAGACIGAIIGGFSGCASCLENYDAEGTWITKYNLFTGAFRGILFGGIAGAILGLLFGHISGHSRFK